MAIDWVVCGATLGAWLLDKTFEYALTRGFEWRRDGDQQAERARLFSDAIRLAFTKALSLEQERTPGLSLPPVARQAIESFFATVPVLATGGISLVPTQATLDRNRANQLLAPLGLLFTASPNSPSIPKGMLASVTEFAREYLGSELEQLDRSAVEVFFKRFASVAADELQKVLSWKILPARVELALDGLTVLQQYAEAQRRAIEDLRRRLYADDIVPCDCAETALGDLRRYAKLHLGAYSPWLTGLRVRVHALLQSLVDNGVTLPSMDKVYVRSRLRKAGEAGTECDHDFEGLPRPHGERSGDNAHCPSLLNVLHHRLVTLTGAPGAGKSFELVRTARILCERAGAGVPGVLPVYLPLPRCTGSSVHELLFNDDTLRPFMPLLATALAALHGLSVVVFLDGFEEIDAARAGALVRSVLGFLANHAGVGFVLAGRAQAQLRWRDLADAGPLGLELAPLSEEQSAAFLSSLAGSLPPAPLTAVREALEAAPPRLSELLQRPLYLTAAVIVAASAPAGAPFPQDAASLIAAFVRHLVLTSVGERGGVTGDTRELVGELLLACERVAAKGSFLTLGKPQSFSSRELLTQRPESMSSQPPPGFRGWDQLLDATGLFHAHPDGYWMFSVFPFQEYFAARGLVRKLHEGSLDPAAFVAELGAAAYSEELPTYLVGLINAGDLAIGAAQRSGLLLELCREIWTLAAGQDDEERQPRTLLMAMRDAWIERFPAAADGAGAPSLDMGLAADPVVNQLPGGGGPVDPFMRLIWREERDEIRVQVEATGNRLGASDAHATGRTKDGPAGAPVEARLAACLQAHAGSTWSVQPWGPTLGAWLDSEPHPRWLLVPAGRYVAGSWENENELPVRIEQVQQPFWVARDPVTVAEYGEFLEAQGGAYRLADPCWADLADQAREVLGDRSAPSAWTEQQMHPQRPVVRVSWFEAAAYCRWRGRGFRLPSESEWEKAARGLFGRRWPWGCAWRPEFVVHGREWRRENLAEVSDNPNVSPFGARGMAGNVWEWCASEYSRRGFADPLWGAGGLRPVKTSMLFVVRGGSFFSDRIGVRCASRLRIGAEYAGNYIGFRCVRDVELPPDS